MFIYQLVFNINLGSLKIRCSCLYDQILIMLVSFQRNVLGWDPRKQGLLGDSVVKNLPANAGEARDSGSIPGLGRSPGIGNDNPLQYSSLENSMDRGAWWATVHGFQRLDTIERQQTHTHLSRKHSDTLAQILSGRALDIFKRVK